MESRTTISVVIPVYNTEDYLCACINSILAQNIDGLEVILVDDGSTDGCWKIIQSYSDGHANIIGIKQTNQGQGVARNVGLLSATGEFVAFVDSDDVVPVSAYKEMYDIAVQHKSDMVVGVLQSFNDTKVWLNVPVHRKYFNQIVVNMGIEQVPFLLEDISCCNKLFRRDLIQQHYIQFPSSFREDLEFTTRLYLSSRKITVIPKVVYHYRGRVGSDTNTVQLGYFEDWSNLIFGLKEAFCTCSKESLFLVLLRSEMQKLVVQSRFSGILKRTSYSERNSIFTCFQNIAKELMQEDIVESGIFSLREQVRVTMLREGEFDILEMFEKKPWQPDYLVLLRNRASYKTISEPLLRIYMQKISILKRGRNLNIRARFPRLLRIYEQIIGKQVKPLRAAWRRKKKAQIPFLPLLFYVFLYPFVSVQNILFSTRRVWLIDERVSQSAEDNGFSFFKYLRETNPDFKIYYVLNSESQDWERAFSLGQVIPQFSIAHAYWLLRSQVLLSTDKHSSLAYPSVIFRRLWKKTYNVFLQHGVMAVKRTVYTHKNYNYLSQVITSSVREKSLFVKDYGFPETKIAVTGLARFDNLKTMRQQSVSQQVLVVPTWRLDLKSQSDVYSSKYLWGWLELLRSPLLSEILEKYCATLVFRPHQNMLPFLSEISVDNNNVAVQTETDRPLSQLIQESDLLITDYSSVMFDFFYQNKPALCYMFDRKDVESSQGGGAHIDLEKELPADIYSSADEVLKSLEWYLENACILKERHVSRVAAFFQYRDDRNCERIFQAVKVGCREKLGV